MPLCWQGTTSIFPKTQVNLRNFRCIQLEQRQYLIYSFVLISLYQDLTLHFFFNETELQDNCSIKILAMVRSSLKNDFGFCFSIKSVFRVSRSERKKNIRCNGNILNCFRSLLLLSYYLHICIMQISMPLFSTVATEEYQLEKRLYASATWH